MIALYIIGGIVAYLLIGAVVVGIFIRIDKSFRNDTQLVMYLWPFAISVALVYLAEMAMVKLAKRIGGVKD